MSKLTVMHFIVVGWIGANAHDAMAQHANRTPAARKAALTRANPTWDGIQIGTAFGYGNGAPQHGHLIGQRVGRRWFSGGGIVINATGANSDFPEIGQHVGFDIAAEAGDAIVAPTDGWVSRAAMGLPGGVSGAAIQWDKSLGLHHVYFTLDKAKTVETRRDGENTFFRVTAGTEIGRATGNRWPSHVHFQAAVGADHLYRQLLDLPSD